MSQMIDVEVMVSFDGLVAGQIVGMPPTNRVRALVEKGLLKEVCHGTGASGPESDPGSSTPSGSGGDPAGDAPSAEPEQGSDTGRHRKTEVSD